MSELTTTQIENTVKYLANVSNMLPSSSTPANFLKSYYLTKCRKLTLGGPVGLPQQFSKTTKRCPRCCVQYEDGPTFYKIQPERRENRFVRRLLKKNVNQESLTRFQQAYLKKLAHKGCVNAHNKLVIICSVCKHETTENLEKPEIRFQTEMPVSVRKSKKKKKKDKFVGLNKDVVLALTPQNKLYNTSNFISLESTPVVQETEQIHKKKLFGKKKHASNKLESSNKLVKTKQKQKKQQMKGLQNILNNSKKKQSPAVSLKQFLTSL